MISPSPAISTPLEHSLRQRTIALNTVWNVLGQSVPLVIAAFTIPLLIRQLGVDRFGVLTLAWALVGYFSLFDLGIGRALTKVVSDRLACGREEDLPSAIWSGLAMMTGLGVCFGAVIWVSVPWIVNSLLRVPSAMAAETTQSLYPLALSIPVITTSIALKGVLEAQHRFGLTNAVRIATGAYNFLGPVIAAWLIAPSLYPVILVLVLGRVVTGVVYLWFCLRGVPGMRQRALLNSADCRDLLTSGSWMTVSNVASPIMVYLDRFLISSMLSVTLVAYYTTPFEVVTKLWIVPLAITSVLFPAFAAFFATDQAKLNETYARGLRNSLSLVFPAIFLLVLFAPEGLRLWLGPVFQRDSTWVLRWIAVGVLLNSVGQVPFALLQAVDRPDITAKLHLCELPVYVIAVVLGIHFFGLGGAAVAWSLRLGIETLVLLMLARRVVTHEALKRNFLLGLILAIGVLGLACLPMPATGKFLLATCVLGCFATFVWRRLLEANEKNHLKLWVERLAWSGMPISSRR